MRARVLVGILLVVVVFGSGGIASTGSHQSPQQWAIVNFPEPVSVHGHFLMGRVLIVHDDARMAKGEPCTSMYRFDRATGTKTLEVEFVCQPEQRTACEKTTLAMVRNPRTGINEMTGYQFAGDSEVHGVPLAR
jgi:hypothetical protein